MIDFLDCTQAGGTQEEAEGDFCRGTRSGHGRPHERMVSASCATDFPTRIRYIFMGSLIMFINAFILHWRHYLLVTEAHTSLIVIPSGCCDEIFETKVFT